MLISCKSHILKNIRLERGQHVHQCTFFSSHGHTAVYWIWEKTQKVLSLITIRLLKQRIQPHSPCSLDEPAELYNVLTSQREMGMSGGLVVAQSTFWKVSLFFISGWDWLQRSSHMQSSAQILPRHSCILEENDLISMAFRAPGNLTSTSPPVTHESCLLSLVRKWRSNAKLINHRQLQFSLNWTNLRPNDSNWALWWEMNKLCVKILKEN